MTTNEPKREPGYRGALPIRDDRLARPWVLTVIGIFVLVVILSIAGVPSRFIPEPTAPALPSIPATPSAEPTESASPSPTLTGSGVGSPSPTPEP